MIKIQKKDFNIEQEIKLLKDKYSNVGAVISFIGFVRDINNKKDVKYIELEVYEKMAIKELSKIKDNAVKKFDLVDCLIVHRYCRLDVNDRIGLVVCFFCCCWATTVFLASLTSFFIFCNKPDDSEEGVIALPNCFFAAVSKRDIA